MSPILFVDVLGGAAGDMLLAALLDAGAPRGPIEEAVSAAVGRPVELSTDEVRRGGIRAVELRLSADLVAPERRRSPAELLEAVERAGLEAEVRGRAMSVLQRLTEAEACVHGLGFEELELDELGLEDTLVDVVGISQALASLDVGRVLVSSLPMPDPSGAGAHGAPAPVTLELLRGFALRPSTARRELEETVTPTAAAVLAALGEPSPALPELVVEEIGYGAGARDPAGVANVVRVLVGRHLDDRASPGRRLLVLEANVDDLSPELVPDAIDALLERDALDAWATPIHMKRGRPAVTISALCEPDALSRVRRAFFEHTTTFGVRIHEVVRPELQRKVLSVEITPGGPSVRVKIGLLDAVAISAKPEHADVVEAATKLDRPVRAVHERASALARRLVEEGAGR